MSKFELDTEFVRKLAAILEETKLGEIELADGDRRIVIGLNGNEGAVQARIRWTDGSEQDLGSFESGKYHRIRKSAGLTPVSITREVR